MWEVRLSTGRLYTKPPPSGWSEALAKNIAHRCNANAKRLGLETRYEAVKK